MWLRHAVDIFDAITEMVYLTVYNPDLYLIEWVFGNSDLKKVNYRQFGYQMGDILARLSIDIS